MKLSEKGFEDILKEEGVRNRAYQDAVGYWTIGVGHLIGNGSDADYKKSSYFDKTLTPTEVMGLLKADCASREAWLSKTLEGYPTTQNQFDALFSLLFNIGQRNLEKSRVLSRHKAGNYAGAAEAFLLHNKARGKVLNALTRRRAREASLYAKK